MNNKCEIVYVLKNEAMPNLIKIGTTQRTDIQAKMDELHSIGVPLPFECLWAGDCGNCKEIESLIHNAFRDKRINPKREFFKMEADQIIPILKKLVTNEITSQIDSALNKNITEEEKSAVKKYRRPTLNFDEMRIPTGVELTYIKDEAIKAKVISSKKVLFEGQEYSLTALTKKLLNLDYNVAPCPYWTYESKSLQNIYDETYIAFSE